MVEMGGVDLPCGAGRLGLKRATGTFPSALGFNSLWPMYKSISPALRRGICFYGIYYTI